jgi:multiple sugar transport system ATP-binding protein
MHQGEVQQFADPDTVYNRPSNVFVAGFMGSPSMNFIPADLTTRDGKAALAVRKADGEAPVLPLHGDCAVPGGEKQVVLGVRPEHLCRFSPEAAARKPGMASITVPVELVEPTGAETNAVMRLGETEIIGRFEPDQAPREGEEIRLGVDMARACLFDPTTTRLI